MEFSIKDKTVIVTGAARGNGKTIADAFVKRGSIVFYIDKNRNVIKNSLIDKTLRSKSLVLDITNENKCHEILNQIDKIDVLINNAGVSLPVDNQKTLNNWNNTLKVNLTSCFNISRIIANKMIKQNKGSIINITSISSYLGSVSNPSYHASKGGVKYLSKSLAADYGKYNIRVNCICPGYIKTKMTQKSFNDRKKNKLILDKTMLGRWGESEDLIGACLFLASDYSSYITGSDILVDGGLINKGIDF